MSTCYIFAAGEFDDIKVVPVSGDYVIAADGGYKYIKKCGIVPDYILGDFDSLGYVPDERDVEVHPVMKDDTDTMIAILHGMNRGYKNFIIYGGLGGRLDHTMANIQSLAFLAAKGCTGILMGIKENVTVTNKSIAFSDDFIGTVSVFSHDNISLGVKETGLLYTIDNFTMENQMVRGISNEFIGKKAEISVEHGTLMIIWESENNSGLPEISNIMTN